MSVNGMKLIAEIRSVAAQFPDRRGRVDKCVYVLNGEPECLIGKALWNLGWIDSSFADQNDNHQVWSKMRECIPQAQEITKIENKWISNVQSQQDSRRTWANAVATIDADFVYRMIADRNAQEEIDSGAKEPLAGF